MSSRGMSILAAVALFTLSGCGVAGAVSESETKALTVTGTMMVKSWEPPASQGEAPVPCVGRYDDIAPGAQVVIRDNAGKTVGLATLSEPEYSDNTEPYWHCEYPFRVANVPKDAPFYSIEVAGRGEVQFPASEMASPIALSVGD